MYAALNQDDQLVYAHNSILGERYYCPKCYRPVQLIIATPQQQPHFRHKTRFSNNDGESGLHIKGKRLLQQDLQQLGIVAQQEVILGTEERRADVLFYYQTQCYAFEFQCAPLSIQELQQRHRSYEQLAVQDIWLIGPTYLTASGCKLHRSALKFMDYRTHWGYFIAVWVPDLSKIRLFHHIAFEPPCGQIRFKSRDVSLSLFLASYFKVTKPLLFLPVMSCCFDPSHWLARQLNFQNSRWRTLQVECYQQGLSLLDLPRQLWLPQRLPPLSLSWSAPLKAQIELYLITGGLTWQQRSQIYLETKWPLVN
ncbi:hypothetical protein FC84_GL000743 [Lapidilactobacillus dextrinicus DSM 20335]|uniref:Competence protein CoiA nuclease-like domain-containing protein n=2 Tax=Lapidilactobacillus dextrinicus TaxID=51664 RepID=A0A0R2BRF1_9LACO|nr:competence protein CoiA family protein [Lapidilactobacillus dextrinicus]KRM78486.1 hypothetical protein FC84_GL000743 [Lapidilactobacillus dextrinicus DSM 20335]